MKIERALKLLTIALMAFGMLGAASRIQAHATKDKSEPAETRSTDDQAASDADQKPAPHKVQVFVQGNPEGNTGDPESAMPLAEACQTNAILDFNGLVGSITVITNYGCMLVQYGDYQWQGLCMLGWSTNGCSSITSPGVTVIVTPDQTGGYSSSKTIGTIEVVGACGKGSANLILPAQCTNCQYQFYTSGCCQVGVCSSCLGYNTPQ
jgi:hypothetical protein